MLVNSKSWITMAPYQLDTHSHVECCSVCTLHTKAIHVSLETHVFCCTLLYKFCCMPHVVSILGRRWHRLLFRMNLSALLSHFHFAFRFLRPLKLVFIVTDFYHCHWKPGRSRVERVGAGYALLPIWLMGELLVEVTGLPAIYSESKLFLLQ